MTVAGYCRTKWVALETHKGTELNSTVRCCYAGRWCPGCTHRQPRSWSIAFCSAREDACTGISFCFSGGFFRMMTGTNSSSGTRGDLESNLNVSRRIYPGLRDRNLPAAPTDRTMQADRRWAGRPGPKSWDSVTMATQQHFHVCETCKGPCVAYSRLKPCRTVDTRVGGKVGRFPPEAFSHSPANFTIQAKLNDPCFRACHIQQVCPFLTPNLSRMGCIFEISPMHVFQCPRETGHAFNWQHQALWATGTPCKPQESELQICLVALGTLLLFGQILGRSNSAQHIPWLCTRRLPGRYRRRPGAFRRQSALRALRTWQRLEFSPTGPSQYRRPGYEPPRRLVGRLLLISFLFGLAAPACSAPVETTDRLSRHTVPTQPQSHLTAYGQTAARMSMARKRAFKRAQLRVLRDGNTVYRGQRHDASSLSLRYLGHSRPRPPPAAPSNCPGRFLKVVTWNCGGLHAGRFAELQAWLSTAQADPVHILMLQECHWPHSTEFNNEQWIHVYSGQGNSQAGVMIMVSRKIAQPHQVRYIEIQPGRMLHTRIELDPPVDALCVYQHAWTTDLSGERPASSRSEVRDDLLRKRNGIWQDLGKWVRSIPARNTLLIGGDMNASLCSSPPHVGPGVQPHKYMHSDQHEFQQLVESNGLIAMNTWCKAGKPAGTFLGMHNSVQIDYLLTRLPCHQDSRKAKALHLSPVVHPTGLRHVPVAGYVPKPTKPHTKPASQLKAHEVHKTLCQQPDLPHTYQRMVGEVMAQHPDMDIDDCLQLAWRTCVRQSKPPSISHPPPDSVSLRSFWDAKRHLRQCQWASAKFTSPVLWHISHATAHSVMRALPQTVRKLRPLFQLWQAVRQFNQQDKALKQRTKQRKQQQVDEQIVAKRIRPRVPKRSIHLRHPDGTLMSEQAELECMTDYFQELFQSSNNSDVSHVLSAPVHVQQWEVDEALGSMPSRKALPPGHAPSVLWKIARHHVGPRLRESFAVHLSAGPLCFPARWHDSHLTLLAKPGKPPNVPANLRPINLLPAEANILARIAATRLRPLVIQATQMIPQFAYVSARQCSDAIDRVLSHCGRIRELLKDQHRNAWRPQTSNQTHQAIGGLQLSLDMAKAFDRLPRPLLQAALDRVGASADLATLIMFIHDNARIIIRRNNLTSTVGMGRGIRQGCGLAPLLWISFTLLIHDRLSTYIPLEAQTSYADDFHLQWEFHTEQACRNACRMVPRIIADLQQLGMDVSLGKTVILWAIKGSKSSQLLREFTATVKGERVFQVKTPTGHFSLPLRRTHDYLGIKIGYHSFERSTVQHRLQLSWVAMHRLHDLLKHRLVPVRKCTLLWQSCVWSVAAYGIPAVGLDQVSAHKLHSGILRQLRIIARSPAHLSHVTNTQLLANLHLTDPLLWLEEQCRKRVAQSQHSVGHLQPTRVHQWWSALCANFSLCRSSPPEAGVLTEVTQILRIRSTCPTRGQSFPSKRALKVHIGKQHPHLQPKHEPNPTVKNQRKDEYRRYAKGGRPQCRFCLKKFYGWPQFMGHFSQNACPKLHLPVAPSSQTEPETPTCPSEIIPGKSPIEPDAGPTPSPVLETSRAFAPKEPEDVVALAEPDPTPLFHRPALQELARQGKLHQLGQEIRKCQLMNHCPECFQWVSSPAYLSRHAVKMHESVRLLQCSVEQWVQQRSGLTKPCQWCGDASFKRHSLHRKSCPVLWMIGHFLGRHSSLKDLGQAVLYDVHGGGAPGSSQGVRHVWSVHDSAPGPSGSPTGRPIAAGLHSRERSPSAGGRGGRAGHGGGSGIAAERSPTESGRGPADQVGEGRGQRGQRGKAGCQAGGGPHGQRQFLEPGCEPKTSWSQSFEDREAGGGGEEPAFGQLGSQGAERVEGGGESHGTAFIEIRGHPRSDSPGRRVYPVFANRGVRKRVCNHAAAVQHCAPVASPERGKARILDKPHAQHPPLQPLQCPPHEARGYGSGPGADGKGEVQRIDRGHDIRVFAMGSCDPPAHQSPGPAVGTPGSSSVGEDFEVLGDVPERRRTLPRPPQDDERKHGGGHHSLLLGGPESHPGVASIIPAHGKALPQFDLALNRRDGQTCQTGPLAACPAPGSPPPNLVSLQAGAVQRLRLSNHSNHCYANAAMHSIAWLACTPPGILCADPTLCRFLRWLARPQPQSSARQPTNLWSTRPWITLMQEWQEPNRQHDIGEFLQFLAPKLAPGHDHDRWQARELSAESAIQVMDQGTLWPLALTASLAASPQSQDPNPVPCDTPVSLQKLVIQWRNQAARHAMMSEPAWLPLQVSRFDSQGYKHYRQVHISDAVYLPSFVGDTLQTKSQRYQLKAVIFHLGDTLLAGHYRAALCEAGRIVSITEDGLTAQPANEADVQAVYSNAYVFMLRKC